MNLPRLIAPAALLALMLAACDSRAPATEAGAEPAADASAGPVGDTAMKPAADTVAEPAANATAPKANPTVGETTVLGPFTGEGAPLHPDNVSPHPIAYYGTDLGFTYEHQSELKILFGDTMANEAGDPIEGTNGRKFEDSFGSIDLAQWQDPTQITPDNIPLIKLGQNPDSTEMAAINPGGHAMEGFKTPVGGFSNGEREFGIFFTFKPQGCSTDADCTGGLQCDQGLGYLGPPWASDEGVTFTCVDGSSEACITATMSDESGAPIADSGMCIDRTSSIWGDTPVGRTASVSVKLLVGTRDPDVPKLYSIDHTWNTNKFMNIALRTVRNFDPADASTLAASNFLPAQDADTRSGTAPRVFMWGRPAFVGVNKANRTVSTYFAYVDLPAGPGYTWAPQFFSGLDDQGLPRFSAVESEAAALDLDDQFEGVQPIEALDVVDQVSVAWVDPLKKWVMLYGGGMVNLPMPPHLPNCGVLEIFTAAECKLVEIGDGAFYLRTADQPWGPWSAPQKVISGGDPAVAGSGQYGVGGMLRHPSCTVEGCAPHTAARDVNPLEYGFFYSANIIEQWTRPAGDGVDIIWNASTWDPYRVILLRTRINP